MKQTLIILGIALLGIAIAVVYFERKIREQNHKIASMFSLVSSLAEELNSIKYNTSVCGKNPETINIGNQLIDVSDDEMELIEEDGSDEDDDLIEVESEASSDNEEDDDEEDDNDSENDVDSENDIDSEVSIEDLDVKEEKKNIKVLKLDLDSDEEKEKEQKTDLKKMSVGELRTLATAKGMNAAKLKKGELIELLSK